MERKENHLPSQSIIAENTSQFLCEALIMKELGEKNIYKLENIMLMLPMRYLGERSPK